MSAPTDPVLTRFRTALDAAYGGRVERVVLFGSRARGEERRESDYDVAVFIKEMMSFGTESAIIADIESEILCDTGAVINAMPLPAGSLLERTGFMRELRRDGVEF